MNLNYPEQISIAHLPTPVERLDRLTSYLGGPELLMKRDDKTGLATGGNKARKLEFLVADALSQGCDHLITMGGPQSNHCRQTAAAAARLGLGCSLVLRASPPELATGNLLLNHLLGARLHWSGDRPASQVMERVALELRNAGRRPYVIPSGGSNAVGATGYVMAMKELTEQLAAERREVDALVFASSSSGTQAGIVLGAELYGFHGRVLGISIDVPADELRSQVATLATQTAAHLGLDSVISSSTVEVNDDYLGAGYGVLSENEREAIRLLARLEGILLDPVYTGRAMAGLLDLIHQGTFTEGQQVLFWHTGGIPTLFAYGEELLS